MADTPAFCILSADLVNALLIAFLKTATGFLDSAIIMENRVGPRPDDRGPYITLLWVEQESLVQLDSYMAQPEGDEDGVEEVKNEARCTVRITVRGDNAYNIASEIRYKIDSSSTAFELWDTIGFSGVSSVMDLSASYGGKMQQRAHIDLSFYAAFGRRYALSWFTSVPWIINNLTTILPLEGSHNVPNASYLSETTPVA